MGRDNIELGKDGELKAVDYLDSRGYEILERNYRCNFGEIDIIARKDGIVCFVEVKTRRNLRHGTPAAAVDRRKLGHISRCAIQYMMKSRPQCTGIRMDVIEVLRTGRKFYIRHLKSVS